MNALRYGFHCHYCIIVSLGQRETDVKGILLSPAIQLASDKQWELSQE
jgi:hypothetical protein